MFMQIQTARELALKVITDIEQNGAYSGVHLNVVFKKQGTPVIDKAFISEIVYGVIRNKTYLDYVIEKFSKVKIKKMSVWIHNILRIGIYQILFMTKIPHSAACNESVNLARRYGHNASAGFVNAVLRKVASEKDKIAYPDVNEDFEKYLSIRYSFPENLTHRWCELYGNEFTEQLMQESNKPPELSIRVNTLATDTEALKTSLTKRGFKVSEGKYCDDALYIRNSAAMHDTDEFKKGLFYTQDEASMIAVRALEPKEGDFVIDVCSAPGGKATYMAQLMNNKGKILARDVHPHKIKLIEENIARLGIDIIEPEIWNSAIIDDRLIKKADAVIADCPCTGYGVIRKKPEIKWARKDSDIDEIASIQKYILSSASEYVRPGGVLVYCTCTMEPIENEDRVLEFLDENSEFSLEDLKPYLPKKLECEGAERGYITLFPNVQGIDGFFIARFKRAQEKGI